MKLNPLEKIDKTKYPITFQISVILILLLGLITVIAPFLLLINISSFQLVFFLSLFFSMAVYFLLFKVNMPSIAIFSLTCILVFIVLYCIGQTIDTSYDGITYHKAAVGALANGWNPYVESIEDWAQQTETIKYMTQFGLWVDHYPKGVWYTSASFYSLTGNIESGKAYTALLMIASFGITNNFLIERHLKKWQSFSISILSVVNPITLSQFLSFYNDAYLMLSLFLIVVSLTNIYFSNNNISYIVLLFSLLICINIKFTAIVYAFFFCAAYLILIIFSQYKNKVNFKIIRKKATIIVICVIVLLIFSGPYVNNYKDHGNPLYPLAGKDSLDIVTSNTPTSYNSISEAEKFFYSTFSHAELFSNSTDLPKLKGLFEVQKNDIIYQIESTDLRVGGFGVFFGVILIISVFVIISSLLYFRKVHKKIFAVLALNSLVILSLLVILKGSWWARYTGYLYGIVIVSLIILFYIINKEFIKIKLLSIFTILFMCLILTNSLLFTPIYKIERSFEINSELHQLSELSQVSPLIMYFGINDYNNYWTGFMYNAMDKNIKFTTNDKNEVTLTPTAMNFIYYSTTK